MPLPPADSPREAKNRRSILIEGFRRADGRWDVEGHLTDTRTHDAVFPGGSRPRGDPIHAMSLRLTVDATGLIVAACAVSDATPLPGLCQTIHPAYERLVGVRVGPGYRKRVRHLFPPASGCTHLSELAIALGTGVLQTLAGDRPAEPDQKPFQLDGCHVWMTDGPQVARFYPRWYRGGREVAAPGDPRVSQSAQAPAPGA